MNNKSLVGDPKKTPSTQYNMRNVSWCNTAPTEKGSRITLKLNSVNVSFLPRKWILEIDFLYLKGLWKNLACLHDKDGLEVM